MPTRPESERFFFLDDDDRDLIALRRAEAHRLGMAVQIGTVPYVGRFLGEGPLAVPREAVEYLAGQFGIADSSCVKRYLERRSTVYEHAAEIQKRFEYRDFADRRWGREFRGFRYGRAWTHAEGPVALFDYAVTWLRKNRVLLPGVSVPARQVSEARTVAAHAAGEVDGDRDGAGHGAGGGDLRVRAGPDGPVAGAGEPVVHAGPVRAVEQGADDRAGAGAAADCRR